MVLAAAVLLVVWLVARLFLAEQQAVWVGAALGSAFLLTAAFYELLVLRPLRRRLRALRVNLGVASRSDGAGAPTELEELLDPLTTLLRMGWNNDSALRQDLLRLQAHNQQLVQVAAMGDRLNAALPYRETVEQMLVQVKSFLRADFVALLGTSDGRHFQLARALGGGSRALDPSCCCDRDDCPLLGAVERNGPLRASDHRCRFFPQTMTHQIALPLTLDAAETCVLLATSTTGARFDLVWDEALVTLRGHLQQSLANARKYDSIRRQVVTDHLTGLYNRRYFINRAGEEIERSLLEQAPVSIVMIDIDHFKRFNDAFGHATGDRVLQAVGAQLAQSVRVSDTCARHGGEEFTLLLPGTAADSAAHLANRVRQTLSQTRYTGLGLPRDAAITISCGVATCPQDATTVETLLELADRALYRAKGLGRDRVCQYEPRSGAGPGPHAETAGALQPMDRERPGLPAGRASSRRLRVP